MKVILNKSFGGFRPSVFAYNEHARRNGVNLYWYEFSMSGYELTEQPGYFDLPLTKHLGDHVSYGEMDWSAVYHLEGESREDADLIDIVEQYGEQASSLVSNLEVVEIPDSLKGRYTIDEYDGLETLHEDVQTW